MSPDTSQDLAVERALFALKAAKRELATAWGDGPDRLIEAEQIDQAQTYTDAAIRWLTSYEVKR